MFQPLVAFLTNTAIGNGVTILAGIVTVLGVPAAVIRWLTRGRRLKLEADYFLSGPDQGNTITIINNSPAPVLVRHWQLVWRKRSLLGQAQQLEEESDYEGGIWRIDPHGAKVLTFEEQSYFAWGRDHAVKGKLYFKLSVVGRKRPVWLMIYDPLR